VSAHLTLITGRTRKQAIGLHKGKSSAEYYEATSIAEMNAEDMARLLVAEGSSVRLTTGEGHIDVRAQAADLPPGLVFVPMGTLVNRLIGAETSGTGMPSFKDVAVEVTPAPGDEVAT
jgi:formylmethanofuran dehydrogenase subunit D